MLNKAINGYSATEIDRALQALDLPQLIQIRAELLDLDNSLLFPLDGLQLTGSITNNVTQPIQRGADLRFIETERGSDHSAPLDTFANTALEQARLFWLRLADTSGNAVDSSGNSRTFTANGGITYSVDGLGAGDPTNTAVTLNGTTGYYSIADAAWMDVTRLTLVIACRSTGTSDTLIDRDDGGSNRFWRLEIDANGNVALSINFTTGVPTRTTFTATGAINDNKPHLIHATYDGAYVQIFVDGKRLLRTAETRTMATGTLAINVGRNLAAANFYAGTIDEVGMLGRALSAKEIRDEYQAWSDRTTELIFDLDRNDRVKIYYGLRMPTAGTDGTYIAEWPQIVAVLTSPKRELADDGDTVILTIACQDQTRLMASCTFEEVTTLASGANYITGTNGILGLAQHCGFDTSDWTVTATTLTAPADVVFEIGTSGLDAINYLLTAINYKLIRFSGDGSAIIEPNVLDVDLPLSDVINSTETKVIEAANLAIEIEARTTINSVIVGNGNPDVTPIIGEWTNTAVTSPSSIIYTDTRVARYQVDVPDQTTATALAEHFGAEHAAAMTRRIRFRTLARPIHDGRDRYDLTIPEIGINTVESYVEDEWRLPLNPAETMEHSMLAVVDVV